MNREAKDLTRRLRRQGFRVEYTGGGHLKVTRTDGRPGVVFMAATSGGGRGNRNAVALLKKIGFDPERKK